MTVAALRNYLSDLSRFVSVAGAKKELTDDLTAIIQGLAPFDTHALKDFSAFLLRAEAFDRTGELPVVGSRKPPRSPVGGGSRTTGGQVDIGAVKTDIHTFYLNAKNPDVTAAMIDEKRSVLQPLSKPQLTEVAGAINLRVPASKSKGQIIDSIIAAIHSMGDEARRIKQ